MEIIRDNVYIKFLLRGKHFDTIVYKPYDGDGFIDYIEGCWIVQDDRLKEYAEFTDLIERMKRDGYEYIKIDPNLSSSYLYDIKKSDYVVIEFLKAGYCHKFIKYDILARTYETHSKNCKIWELFKTDRNIEERKRLIAEVKRVEKEFNCSYIKYSWTGTYLLFDCSDGSKLICVYEPSNHRIRKVINCNDKNLFKNQLKYNLDRNYYCYNIFDYV